jgi:diadenosine tetraphosphate (Ap4A) HIT family hydrolase
MIIWQNEHFFIEPHPHQLPWIKIFTHHPYKELTDLPPELFEEIWKIYATCEKQMRDYFHPDKINMASFANMLPRVHIHVMARFEDDSHFPNPLWGEELRNMDRKIAPFEPFYTQLNKALTKKFS